MWGALRNVYFLEVKNIESDSLSIHSTLQHFIYMYRYLEYGPLLICTWYLKNQVWKMDLDELDFWSSSNLIFTACVGVARQNLSSM